MQDRNYPKFEASFYVAPSGSRRQNKEYSGLKGYTELIRDLRNCKEDDKELYIEYLNCEFTENGEEIVVHLAYDKKYKPWSNIRVADIPQLREGGVFQYPYSQSFRENYPWWKGEKLEEKDNVIALIAESARFDVADETSLAWLTYFNPQAKDYNGNEKLVRKRLIDMQLKPDRLNPIGFMNAYDKIKENLKWDNEFKYKGCNYIPIYTDLSEGLINSTRPVLTWGGESRLLNMQITSNRERRYVLTSNPMMDVTTIMITCEELE